MAADVDPQALADKCSWHAQRLGHLFIDPDGQWAGRIEELLERVVDPFPEKLLGAQRWWCVGSACL
jgi:hypothetical protein